jgi:Response regulator containing a CheY-like receiver domain and an HTH DNA-binding domain
MITINIIEDHHFFAEGLKGMINASGIATVTNVYYDLQSSRAGMTFDNLPDVLLLDIQLPDGNGIDFCSELKKRFPDLKIIMLTMFNEVSIAKRSIHNGALGYLLKSSTSEEVIAGIETVNTGNIFMCKDIDLTIKKAKSDEVLWLSDGEKKVLRHIAEGYTDTQIAEKIFRSQHTVKGIRKDLLLKFGAKNCVQLVVMAKQQMLI